VTSGPRAAGRREPRVGRGAQAADLVELLVFVLDVDRQVGVDALERLQAPR
jgi:hypothetical protein